MKKRILFFACALMLAAIARAQWSGLEVKTIGTTPATTLNSGYYALFQNGHKGFAFLSQSMLNLWGTNYNLAKNRINANAPGISAFADLNQNIASGPAPNDRKWYVFKITNNGNGTCTIQCPDGTYIPAFGNRVKLVSSTTPGVFTFHNHGNYFSFVNNGQGLDGDNYQAGYDNVSTLASWDYTTPAANGNAAWTLYPVEMTAPINTNKHYLLKHVQTGLYLYLHDNYQETRHVDATTLREVGTPFIFTKNGTGYTLTQVGTTKTLGCSNGTWAAWNTANNVATQWQFTLTGDGNDTYYISSVKGNLSANPNEAANGAFIYTNHPKQTEAKWQLVEAGAVIGNPLPDKVFALYNACTNGDYPVIGNPGIATSTTAAPQLYVLRAAGADPKGTSLFRLQKASMDGKYLTWTNNSPTSVTHSEGISKFLFVNNAKSGYAWNSGTAPVAPLYNFVGYADNNYTVFCDKKSTSNTGFDGYSRRTASTLLNNAQSAKGANYNTTWLLYQQPYEVYNVVVNGHNTAKVSYSHPLDNTVTHAPQGNGGNFVISYDALSTLSTANFTPEEIEGHICEVSLEGNTVTVDYRSNVDVTYIYKYGNTEWYRETRTVKAGIYPDLTSPPTGVRYANVPFGKLLKDETVVINCEVADNRVVPSESFENAVWTYLSIVDNYGNAYYLHYDANNPNKMSVSATNPSSSANYKWAFVGNPFTGYKIYNQATGSGKILSSTNPNGDGNTGGNTFPHMVDETDNMVDNGYNKYWTVTPNALGMLLARKGQNIYANNRNGNFAFWNNGNDAGSRMFVVPIENMNPTTALVDSKGEAISSDKIYRIANRHTGMVIGVDGSLLRGRDRGDGTGQRWSFTASGNGFQIKNVAGNYATGGPTGQGWASTAAPSDNATTLYLYASSLENGVQYYYINDMASVTPQSAALRHFIGDDSEWIRSRGSTAGEHMEWCLEEVVPEVQKQYASNITSGNYYRLVNRAYGGNALQESNGLLYAKPANDGVYEQVWKITQVGGKYQLQNVFTNNYIPNLTGVTYQQVPTASSAGSFELKKVEEGGAAYFSFRSGGGGSRTAFHNQSDNNIVGWYDDASASLWRLEEVQITTAKLHELAEIKNFVSNDYTNNLMNFFTDYACTQLKSNYASMSDAQLRSAMSNLPSVLQDMAVKVKNNTWNASKSQMWNTYEKDFRIHDYEVYSSAHEWSWKLGIGPFARITQPSGIKVKAGEPIMLFVNENVADNDAKLLAEIVYGVDVDGSQYGLKRGYNVILPASDGEMFITYKCTNTNKLLSNYPKIKVHIEGGECNGFFDMSRGHGNNDWMWLTKNMFKDQYLHIKGISTLLNCYLGRVKATTKIRQAMEVWDFVFDTEQKLMVGNRFDGYYKMMITNRDVTSGNPYWGGGASNYPGIYANDLLNINNFTYLGAAGGSLWVIEHEEGHGHQGPINVAGSTEISNNGLAQIVNHLWGRRTSRHKPQYMLHDFFNQGNGWPDYMSEKGLWLANKMWYQLWLYFHQKGDDDFFPRWVKCIQDRGGIRRGNDWNNPVSIASDYMLLGLAACEASQTDLYEFFKGWGFFNYAEDIKIWDGNSNGVVHVADYSHHYLKVPRKSVSSDVAQMEAWKAEMQSYPNKAPGAIFINDTGELVTVEQDAMCAKYDPWLLTQSVIYCDELAESARGRTGHYIHFGVNEADNLGFTQNGNTITITGNGAVGFKIYNAASELIWLSSSKTFTVNNAIAEGIQNGTYSLVASLGDDTDLLLSGPGTMYTGYANNAKSLNDGAITDVKSIETNDNTGETKIYDLQGRQLKSLQKGINIVNGKKVIVK